jgi:hypothetical protein
MYVLKKFSVILVLLASVLTLGLTACGFTAMPGDAFLPSKKTGRTSSTIVGAFMMR